MRSGKTGLLPVLAKLPLGVYLLLSAVTLLICASGIILFLLCKSIAKQQDAPFSRPFGATENDAQKLHALWLLPVIVVCNTAHEVLYRW